MTDPNATTRILLRCAYCGQIGYCGPHSPKFSRFTCTRCHHTSKVPVTNSTSEVPVHDEAGPITKAQMDACDAVLNSAGVGRGPGELHTLPVPGCDSPGPQPETQGGVAQSGRAGGDKPPGAGSTPAPAPNPVEVVP